LGVSDFLVYFLLFSHILYQIRFLPIGRVFGMRGTWVRRTVFLTLVAAFSFLWPQAVQEPDVHALAADMPAAESDDRPVMLPAPEPEPAPEHAPAPEQAPEPVPDPSVSFAKLAAGDRTGG